MDWLRTVVRQQQRPPDLCHPAGSRKMSIMHSLGFVTVARHSLVSQPICGVGPIKAASGAIEDEEIGGKMLAIVIGDLIARRRCGF
jgi:hypothetical protein